MLLRALKDIPSTVAMIPAGRMFHEMDPNQCERLIRMGDAVSAEAKPVDAVAKAWEWHGLDWRGATVVIIGGGESATDERIESVLAWRNETLSVEVSKINSTDPLPSRRVIAINTSYEKARLADMVYACDGRWWTTPFKGQTHFEKAMQIFRQDQLWTQDKDTAQKLGLQYVESTKLPGLNKNPAQINQGQSGGYQAINIAYHAGARNIVLLGFDAKGGHHHGDHPPGIAARSPFKAWIENAKALAKDLKAEGVTVTNCSVGTAIDAFPVKPLEEVCPSQSATSVPSQPLGAMLTSTDSSALVTESSITAGPSLRKTS